MDGVVGEASTGGKTSWRAITLSVMALLGVATLVALTLILTGANRQRDAALQAESHSYEVMILARTLSGTIARSEASLGRYVVSMERPLGQIYFDQWRLASSQLDRLDQLTDDHIQQARINRLRDAFQTRGEELSLIALSINYRKKEQALGRYYQAAGTPARRTIDRLLDQVIARERSVLERRTAAAMASVGRSSRVAGLLAVLGLILLLGLVTLGWMTVQAVADRAIARSEADAERARAEELARAVDEATSELRIQEGKLRQVQKMEAVGQLTGGIAHDFNNMLAVVLGGLELARRHVVQDPASAARHIEQATDGANRAAALTRRLLAFSREDSLRPQSIAAGALVSGMSDLLDRTLGDAITVVVQDAAHGWRIHADRIQLENAILNLAVNARDAMEGRGTLTIATTARTLRAGEVAHCAAGEYVAVAVADTGHGMTPEVVERAFEPFFTTKQVGKGTGLGLSQIFALVRQLGGEIAIDSAPGHGTEVTLFLPRDRSDATAGAVVEIAAASSPPPASLQILVVEDDPRVLAATVGALEELGHRVVACDDPFAAAGLLDRHDGIDLIVTDVLMPRRTGPEMIAALDSRHAHIAVLFVTGFAGEANASEFGRHEVLRKPFTLAGLDRSIAAAMAADRPAPPTQLAAE